MIAITISWIAILVVFLSFGDFLVLLYNKLCRKNETYELVDTFLIGMGFTLILLSISSLWLPSDQYILFIYLLLSIIYWFVRKKHFKEAFKNTGIKIKKLPPLQIIIFIITVISFMIVIIWQVGVFDSLLYHQQNIRWNEEYAVVPGLGNLEHRFGFNSNYLLLSAIFSFRFLFGESVYSLHALVLLCIICWIIKEIITSGYEIKRIALIIPIIGYIFIFGYSFTATSTDLIPNIITFYLIAKILLYPNSLKDKLVLLFFIPVCLITFKLSIAPICLITLYIFISQIKLRNYKPIIFLSLISFIIISLWCIRNVIVSGYLIFPFYEIDFFSVDWKIPKHIAIEERDFILSCGVRVFGDMLWRISHWDLNVQAIIDWFTYSAFIGSIVISPLIVLYSIFKKKFLNKTIYFIYLILLTILLVWYKGGPDPRFIGGVLFSVIYFILFLLLSTKEEKRFPKLGMITITAFAFLMGYWAISRTNRFINMFNIKQATTENRPFSDIIWRQYPYRELLKSKGWYSDTFILMKLDNGAILYISKSPEIPKGRFVCFEAYFPSTTLKKDDESKYQDISEITTRGTSLQDGFKPIK